MNNDFDQIEKMLAERLRSIDAPGASADAAWDTLSAKLPAPKRKRRFFFLLWGLLLISAASTAIYFYHKPTSIGVQVSANNYQPKANGEKPTANRNQHPPKLQSPNSNPQTPNPNPQTPNYFSSQISLSLSRAFGYA
jgi:hypothetical protein